MTESIAIGTTRPVGVDLLTHHDVTTWLVWEAELLDQRRFREWLSLLADDIRYRMPVTVTTARRDTAVPLGAMGHFDEDRYSLEKRVSNVRVTAIPGRHDLEARSYLLLYRSRGDDRTADILSVERTDRLRPVPGGWNLVARDITIDEAVLRTQNLALFL
jgi:phthalate 3,4-dioxygenase beta subunit